MTTKTTFLKNGCKNVQVVVKKKLSKLSKLSLKKKLSFKKKLS